MHRRWLAGLRFEHAVHHTVLEDRIAAVEAATARRDRLEAVILPAMPNPTGEAVACISPELGGLIVMPPTRSQQCYPPPPLRARQNTPDDDQIGLVSYAAAHATSPSWRRLGKGLPRRRRSSGDSVMRTNAASPLTAWWATLPAGSIRK